jgi:Actinobacteria/chloroflexi VLRF1 release factor
VPRRVSVPPERLARWIEGFAERHGGMHADATDDTVRLRGEDGSSAVLHVPFPPLAPAADPGAALVAHAAATRTVGVLLVRRGGYAAGVFTGADVVRSKVGAAYVQSTTKAGGWSQHRYANRRANQARAAFAEAADAASRILLGARLDALVAGGDRAAVDAVLADPRLEAVRPLVAARFLAVPDPRLKVLQATPGQFRAVLIDLEP